MLLVQIPFPFIELAAALEAPEDLELFVRIRLVDQLLSLKDPGVAAERASKDFVHFYPI